MFFAVASFLTSGAILANDLYHDYQRKVENDRYWRDYEENTGITPLYPYRAGSVVDYVGTALTATQGVLSLYRRF